MKSVSKPVSPHLTIYKPQITTLLSILHRISGFLLYLGLLLLGWVIIFSAFDDVILASSFLDLSVLVFSSIIGKFLLFIWVFSLNFHTVNGIRHLIWDAGIGFSKEAVTRSGVIALISALILTIISWILIFEVIFSYV
jgi:succinate dehydrogenase / fumarate reductase, cytochrome b subunit